MTENHPITPPKHLLSHWTEVINYGYSPERIEEMLTEAARWGADQELEACDKAVRKILQMNHVFIDDDFLRELRSARRPEPPSLKAQALAALQKQFANEFMESDESDIIQRDIIRRAIEALPD